MPADRAQANQGVGKVPKLILAVLWGTPARKLGKALSRMARRVKQGQRSSFLFKKIANTRSHSVHWWLSHQRPVRVELHCQTRCNYHPWRQCSLYGLNLQLDSGCGSSHPCLLLDCPKRRELDHHPHRFSELATKSGMGNPDWNVSVVDSHLRKLLWLYCPRHARVKGNDQADRLAGKASHASRKIWSVEELETLPAGTKPRTSHHQSPGREVWKEEALDIFLEWTWESHCQSNKDLGLFQRWFGETSEMGWSTYGLFQAHRYHLELNWYKILVTKQIPGLSNFGLPSMGKHCKKAGSINTVDHVECGARRQGLLKHHVECAFAGSTIPDTWEAGSHSVWSDLAWPHSASEGRDSPTVPAQHDWHWKRAGNSWHNWQQDLDLRDTSQAVHWGPASTQGCPAGRCSKLRVLWQFYFCMCMLEGDGGGRGDLSPYVDWGNSPLTHVYFLNDDNIEKSGSCGAHIGLSSRLNTG